MLERHPMYLDAAIRERQARICGFIRPKRQERAMHVTIAIPEGAEVRHLGRSGTYQGRLPSGRHVIQLAQGGVVALDDADAERQYSEGHLEVVR